MYDLRILILIKFVITSLAEASLNKRIYDNYLYSRNFFKNEEPDGEEKYTYSEKYYTIYVPIPYEIRGISVKTYNHVVYLQMIPKRNGLRKKSYSYRVPYDVAEEGDWKIDNDNVILKFPLLSTMMSKKTKKISKKKSSNVYQIKYKKSKNDDDKWNIYGEQLYKEFPVIKNYRKRQKLLNIIPVQVLSDSTTSVDVEPPVANNISNIPEERNNSVMINTNSNVINTSSSDGNDLRTDRFAQEIIETTTVSHKEIYDTLKKNKLTDITNDSKNKEANILKKSRELKYLLPAIKFDNLNQKSSLTTSSLTTVDYNAHTNLHYPRPTIKSPIKYKPNKNTFSPLDFLKLISQNLEEIFDLSSEFPGKKYKTTTNNSSPLIGSIEKTLTTSLLKPTAYTHTTKEDLAILNSALSLKDNAGDLKIQDKKFSNKTYNFSSKEHPQTERSLSSKNIRDNTQTVLKSVPILSHNTLYPVFSTVIKPLTSIDASRPMRRLNANFQLPEQNTASEFLTVTDSVPSIYETTVIPQSHKLLKDNKIKQERYNTTTSALFSKTTGSEQNFKPTINYITTNLQNSFTISPLLSSTLSTNYKQNSKTKIIYANIITTSSNIASTLSPLRNNVKSSKTNFKNTMPSFHVKNTRPIITAQKTDYFANNKFDTKENQTQLKLFLSPTLKTDNTVYINSTTENIFDERQYVTAIPKSQVLINRDSATLNNATAYTVLRSYSQVQKNVYATKDLTNQTYISSSELITIPKLRDLTRENKYDTTRYPTTLPMSEYKRKKYVSSLNNLKDLILQNPVFTLNNILDPTKYPTLQSYVTESNTISVIPKLKDLNKEYRDDKKQYPSTTEKAFMKQITYSSLNIKKETQEYPAKKSYVSSSDTINDMSGLIDSTTENSDDATSNATTTKKTFIIQITDPTLNKKIDTSKYPTQQSTLLSPDTITNKPKVKDSTKENIDDTTQFLTATAKAFLAQNNNFALNNNTTKYLTKQSYASSSDDFPSNYESRDWTKDNTKLYVITPSSLPSLIKTNQTSLFKSDHINISGEYFTIPTFSPFNDQLAYKKRISKDDFAKKFSNYFFHYLNKTENLTKAKKFNLKDVSSPSVYNKKSETNAGFSTIENSSDKVTKLLNNVVKTSTFNNFLVTESIYFTNENPKGSWILPYILKNTLTEKNLEYITNNDTTSKRNFTTSNIPNVFTVATYPKLIQSENGQNSTETHKVTILSTALSSENSLVKNILQLSTTNKYPTIQYPNKKNVSSNTFKTFVERNLETAEADTNATKQYPILMSNVHTDTVYDLSAKSSNNHIRESTMHDPLEIMSTSTSQKTDSKTKNRNSQTENPNIKSTLFVLSFNSAPRKNFEFTKIRNKKHLKSTTPIENITKKPITSIVLLSTSVRKITSQKTTSTTASNNNTTKHQTTKSTSSPLSLDTSIPKAANNTSEEPQKNTKKQKTEYGSTLTLASIPLPKKEETEIDNQHNSTIKISSNLFDEIKNTPQETEHMSTNNYIATTHSKMSTVENHANFTKEHVAGMALPANFDLNMITKEYLGSHTNHENKTEFQDTIHITGVKESRTTRQIIETTTEMTFVPSLDLNKEQILESQKTNKYPTTKEKNTHAFTSTNIPQTTRSTTDSMDTTTTNTISEYPTPIDVTTPTLSDLQSPDEFIFNNTREQNYEKITDFTEQYSHITKPKSDLDATKKIFTKSFFTSIVSNYQVYQLNLAEKIQTLDKPIKYIISNQRSINTQNVTTKTMDLWQNRNPIHSELFQENTNSFIASRKSSLNVDANNIITNIYKKIIQQEFQSRNIFYKNNEILSLDDKLKFMRQSRIGNTWPDKKTITLYRSDKRKILLRLLLSLLQIRRLLKLLFRIFFSYSK